MKKNEIIAVTGMTGVGKDYLVDRANHEHGLGVVNLGTLVGEELAADRDLMMDIVEPKRIRAAQFIVYRKVLAMQPQLVTCHAVRPQNEGFAYDLEIERLFNPSCYVFITAPAEVIAERVLQRNQTGERKSPELPIAEIDRVQQIKLDAVGELSQILECDLLVLNNVNEELNENVRRLGQQIGALILGALSEP
jgi:adenylate kinase